ncbi:hypothetical protein IJG71_03585, partial [Candidatus Saccharibacteria bacterium]|nr:hypothetical protein [Candidatus Saccharibacteria bacterium]
ALFEHPLEQKIHEIADEEPEAYWLAVNNRLLASVGIANGARMLNMVNFYPDYGKWEIIDPEGEYDEIYNRYAHINVKLTDKETEFKAGETADLFNLSLSCSDVEKLSVKYLVVAGEIGACEKDFEKIYDDSEGNYYIYERIEK